MKLLLLFITTVFYTVIKVQPSKDASHTADNAGVTAQCTYTVAASFNGAKPDTITMTHGYGIWQVGDTFSIASDKFEDKSMAHAKDAE